MKSINKTIIVFGVLSILLFSTNIISATATTNHTVTIDSIDDTYTIEEKITIQQDNATIKCYLPSNINDLSAVINNTDIPINKKTENQYIINYTQGINQDQTTVTITYSMQKTATTTFTKEFTYNTNNYKVTLDQDTLSTTQNLNQGSKISLQLPEKQDTTQSLNLYTTILIALLLVLLIVTSVYGFKKRKNGNKRHRENESTEMLSTEKSLLMHTLKDIEKKHRDHKISDETYEKLKSHYKQQTVDIMSNLEE